MVGIERHFPEPAHQSTKMAATTFTVKNRMTVTEFKEKHGGMPIGAWCPQTNVTHIKKVCEQINKLLTTSQYNHIEFQPVMRTTNSKGDLNTFVAFGIRGTGEYDALTKSSGKPIFTFPNGYQLFSFVKPFEEVITLMDDKLTNKPKKADELEQAKNEIEELRKQLHEEKMKNMIQEKIKQFHHDITEFKNNYFTKEEHAFIKENMNIDL